MNKAKLILIDGSGVDLESAGSIENLSVIFDNMTALGSFWNTLTAENLKTVTLQNGEGLTVGSYKNMVLCTPAFHGLDKNEDGTLIASFGLREKSELELLKEQVAVNTEAISVHEDAIGDMGSVLSAVAEAQEGDTN